MDDTLMEESGSIKRGNFDFDAGEQTGCRKKSKISPEMAGEFRFAGGGGFFDGLPDDLVLSILCELSASASCPADFINLLITCKRFNGLGLQPLVLSKANHGTLAVKAQNWSESAHRFLKLCADTGNVEACFILGMIHFYCLRKRGTGVMFIAKAAIGKHPSAMYAYAIIMFNGSGGTKNDKDCHAGIEACRRAAFLGHVDALRELGHCLEDGFGVEQNIAEGRRLIAEANARELAQVLVTRPPSVVSSSRPNPTRRTLPSPEPHPANRFLLDWFSYKVGNTPGSGLRLCSYSRCRRPETWIREFGRCPTCETVSYCSRVCEALNWKIRHRAECMPVEVCDKVKRANNRRFGCTFRCSTGM